MIPAVVVLSFVLDNVFSNFVSIHGLFMPLFTLMALIIIYPYFNQDAKNYLLTCFFTGLAYDLIYTDTVIIHAFLFLIIGYLIMKLNLIFSNNYLNVSIMAVICIVVYRIIYYILLLMTANLKWSGLLLLKSIYSSLILNIIYILLAFLITDRLSFKFKIKKAD